VPGRAAGETRDQGAGRRARRGAMPGRGGREGRDGRRCGKGADGRRRGEGLPREGGRPGVRPEAQGAHPSTRQQRD
jgi:hypothetical protein